MDTLFGLELKHRKVYGKVWLFGYHFKRLIRWTLPGFMSWWYRKKHRILWLRRVFLWLALGPGTYSYMKRSLSADSRTKRAREVDIVVRKDGLERRIEADWARSIARIIVKG